MAICDSCRGFGSCIFIVPAIKPSAGAGWRRRVGGPGAVRPPPPPAIPKVTVDAHHPPPPPSRGHRGTAPGDHAWRPSVCLRLFFFFYPAPPPLFLTVPALRPVSGRPPGPPDLAAAAGWRPHASWMRTCRRRPWCMACGGYVRKRGLGRGGGGTESSLRGGKRPTGGGSRAVDGGGGVDGGLEESARGCSLQGQWGGCGG